jgi:hypothetical protein
VTPGALPSIRFGRGLGAREDGDEIRAEGLEGTESEEADPQQLEDDDGTQHHARGSGIDVSDLEDLQPRRRGELPNPMFGVEAVPGGEDVFFGTTFEVPDEPRLPPVRKNLREAHVRAAEVGRVQDESSPRAKRPMNLREESLRGADVLDDHVGGDEIERKGAEGKALDVAADAVVDRPVVAERREIVVDSHATRRAGLQRGGHPVRQAHPVGKEAAPAAQIEPDTGSREMAGQGPGVGELGVLQPGRESPRESAVQGVQESANAGHDRGRGRFRGARASLKPFLGKSLVFFFSVR